MEKCHSSNRSKSFWLSSEVKMTMFCLKCYGEGAIYASRYGGLDPDVYRVGPCEDCGGTGKAICEARGCKEEAVASLS